jgi:hypothetical protein
MKPHHIPFARASVLALLLLTGAEARTWTSADGAKTFEGELRSYDAAAANVTVTLPNGKPLVFMQDKLSADDIAFVKETAAHRRSRQILYRNDHRRSQGPVQET